MVAERKTLAKAAISGQLHLWKEPRRLARKTDPSTSHEAARDLVSSGTLSRRINLALSVLVAHPGSTARELDRHANVTDGAVRKRLNDLRKHRLAETRGSRLCEVTGKTAQLWYPTTQ